jgi:hypothetical protein
VQNLPTDTAAATTKWGDIGDWDVSGVGDFSFAFSTGRNEVGGSWVSGSNKMAAMFVGTAISKWDTASATTLGGTFLGAIFMNADLSGWKVGKVTSLDRTFLGASKFIGTGLASWDTASTTTLFRTFREAGKMNADLSGWNVEQLASITCAECDGGKMSSMTGTFTSTTSLSSCNKRKIANAWKSNSRFAIWNTAWAADTCPVRLE